MRILLVNDYGTASGGAERQMLALRADLRARGHAARLLTSDAILVPGWPIEADSICRGTVGRLQPYLQTWNPWAARALARELKTFRPDVVHLRMYLWQMSPALLPLLADVPTVYQAAVYKSVCPTGLKILPDGRACTERAGLPCLRHRCVAPPTWLSAMRQLALVRRHRGAIDRIVALSRDMAATLEADGLGPVEVIHNGIAERPMRPPLAGPPILAYAGRLSREKGVAVLLDAFAQALARVPDARLILAGTGPLEGDLRARAAPLGRSVEFLGYLRQDAMEQRFDSAWAQAAPSLWQEPFGNVATEAMMRGTAVIATGSGGFAEMVVEGETGLLTPAGDVAALAGAIATLLSDRSLAERMGAAGRRRALARFSRAAVTDRFEALYQMLHCGKGLDSGKAQQA
jgi:glycosyltransferase involved in cell wall biosynthesis